MLLYKKMTTSNEYHDLLVVDCKRNFLFRKYNYSIMKNYKHKTLMCGNFALLFTQRFETVNGEAVTIISRNKHRVNFLFLIKVEQRNFS